MSSSDFIVKPISTGVTAYLLDVFVLKETNTTKSISLGVSAAAGVTIGGMVGGLVPPINFNNTSFFGNGKGLSSRITEIGAGAASSYIINNYAMKNVGYRDTMYNTIGVIVVADLVGEYISDFIAGRPLAIFA